MSYPLLRPKGGWRDSGMWDDGGSESDGDMPALHDPDDGSIGSDSDADLDLDDPDYANRNLHDSSSEPRLNGHADDGEAEGPKDYADSNDRAMQDSSKVGDDEARRLKNEHRNQQSRAKHNSEKIEEAPEDEAAEGEATEEAVDTTADTAAADTAVVEEGSGVAGAAEAGDVAGEAAVEPVVVEVIADGAAAVADGGAVGGAIGAGAGVEAGAVAVAEGGMIGAEAAGDAALVGAGSAVAGLMGVAAATGGVVVAVAGIVFGALCVTHVLPVCKKKVCVDVRGRPHSHVSHCDEKNGCYDANRKWHRHQHHCGTPICQGPDGWYHYHNYKHCLIRGCLDPNRDWHEHPKHCHNKHCQDSAGRWHKHHKKCKRDLIAERDAAFANADLLNVDNSYIVVTNADNFQKSDLDVLKDMVIFPDEESRDGYASFENGELFSVEGVLSHVNAYEGVTSGNFSFPHPNNNEEVQGRYVSADPRSTNEKAQEVLGEIVAAHKKAGDSQ